MTALFRVADDCVLDSAPLKGGLDIEQAGGGISTAQQRAATATAHATSNGSYDVRSSWSAAATDNRPLSPQFGSSSTSSRERDRGIVTSRAAVMSGLLYCISSAALTLLNKKVLVHYDFTAVHALLCFHCVLAVLLVKACALLGWAQVEPLSWDLVRLWMPVNVIFVAMLATNFYALKLVGVGMVSLLKNLSNLFILCGDLVFFGRTYSWHVWVCLALMVASVLSGGASDSHFTWQGYAWQMANNVFTAGYALYLSRVTERVSSATHEHRPLNQMSMCYYNNMLSIPLTLLLVLGHGELSRFWQQQALYQPSFQALAVLGGVFGFVLSFSSIWFVSLTTATFYSLVGSFNKVAVAVAGIIYFNEQPSMRNLASIGAGLLAGSLLPLIKMRTAHRSQGDRARGGAAGRSTSPAAKS